MAIRFFFEYGNTLIQLPVNPESIAIKHSGNNRTEEVVKLGEVNIIKDTKLKDCSFNCFFPATSIAPYVLTKGKFEQPQFYIDFFNKIRKEKQPCRFIVSDLSINMLVSIENFEYSIEAGDDDVHYTINLKEYRTYAPKVMRLLVDPVNPPIASVSKEKRAPAPKSFSVGDAVRATGKYTADSYGGGRSGTFPKDFVGKITIIVADKSRARRYHISTPQGGARGWVTDTQISHNT